MKLLKFTLLLLAIFQFSACGTVTTEEEKPANEVQDKNSTEITTNEEDNVSDINHTEINVEVNKTINLDNFINDVLCDQVIEKEFSTGGLLSICYDYGYKSAKYVGYTLDGTLINSVNLEDRPRFYTEREIPKEYQILYSDYTRSGYDRGHLAPDADFDYIEEDLKVIYSLANIIPQDPNVNRYFWTKAEYQERLVAASLGELSVINGVVFDEKPTYIGTNQIAVSKAFWKILYNDEKEFRQCYYYDNFVLGDADLDTLAKHKVDCDTLIIGDES
jgi:endonuclease G